ncbi:hypothetical protein [Brasilonema bromeliae]|uniref:Uncharacterized protein n=1 Tax=Brasilonema bromeliae SPC951 TaxID=385972 RepID=A0ABX1P4B3_9CYAN|nr:hypothetical protein [Brasilonema bromeliae]NMG18923.1 hypothetical protein [Brasilonema bromeliae SPC951]
MSTQFFLEETDIDTLINLLLRSQQSRTREALCVSIGIDPKRLSFIRDSSESDFFLLLIRYLNEIGEQEALCKLCCKELLPVFHHGKYAPILSEIAAKLNCNQKLSQNFTNNQQPTVLSSSPAPSVSVNPFIQLAKNKFIRYSVIVIIGLAGFVSFIQSSKLSSNADTTEQPVSLSPTAKSNKSVNQQIIDIYQEVLGRKPTDNELNSNVNLLENRQAELSNIRAWITKTSSLLQDGNVISLECLGNQYTGLRFLDSRIKNNNVSLGSSNIDASTKWKVHIINNRVVALENQGVINGSKWLDGVTADDSVKLAPNTKGGYTGTKWTINILGDGVVALDNQGKSKWLDGVTADGSVRLAPNTEGNTGIRWRISKQ